MHTYSDDMINDWADVYQACRLQQIGIRFEKFIEAPVEILARLGMNDAEEIMSTGFLPLLPIQAQVRMALTRQSAITSHFIHRQRIPQSDNLNPNWRAGAPEPLGVG